MKTIYIVRAVTAYEGTEQLCAFTEESDAHKLADELNNLRVHVTQRWRESTDSCMSVVQYAERLNEYYRICDVFDVINIPLNPSTYTN